MHNVIYYFWLQSKGGLHRYVFKTVLIDIEHLFSLGTHGFKNNIMYSTVLVFHSALVLLVLLVLSTTAKELHYFSSPSLNDCHSVWNTLVQLLLSHALVYTINLKI